MNNPSTPSQRPSEGFVVTEGGVRREGDVHKTRPAAEAAAAKRKPVLTEQGGNPAPQLAVKQQLHG